jgi:hypothetical protein
MTVEQRPSARVPAWLLYLESGAVAVTVHDAFDGQAVARRSVDRDAGTRRRISFRKPTVTRPAFGREPG